MLALVDHGAAGSGEPVAALTGQARRWEPERLRL